jgi:hypothetical protein
MRNIVIRWLLAGAVASTAAEAFAQGFEHEPEAIRHSFRSGAVQPVLAESSPSDMPFDDEPSLSAPQVELDDPLLPIGCSPRDRCCCPGDVAWSLTDELCGACPPFVIGGWTQLGYHDGIVPLSRFENDLQSFEDIPHQVQLNQQWFYAERLADATRHGSDWGFRLDIVYGTDAQKTQAFGNPGGRSTGRGRWDASLDHGKYGWAIPQAYVEYAAGDWNVIVGHFFSPLGYEVIPSVGNFFYSRSLTMFNSEPFTHTGVLSSWSGIDDIKLYAGWSAGWDSGFDSFNSGSNFIGGFAANLTDDVTFTYLATAGNFGWLGNEGGAVSQSMVMTARLTGALEYVLQSDVVDIDEGRKWQYDTVGLNQYLFYSLSDRWKAGVRGEWWKADGVSHNEVTCGLNYHPHANIVVRPEYRYDWSPGANYNVGTFSVDVIFAY